MEKSLLEGGRPGRGAKREQHEQGSVFLGFMLITGFRLLNIFHLINYQYKQSHGIMIASLDVDYGVVSVRSFKVIRL